MKHKYIPENIRKEICEKYLQGISIKKLRAYYHTSYPFVKEILSENSINLRPNTPPLHTKYTFNDKYFDIINTEEKAYFLGLLYADGCNSNNTITLQLHEKDIELVRKFKEAIQSTSPIHHMMAQSGSPHVRLAISNKYLSESLTKAGCFSRKSLTLRFPTEEQVPKHLIHHFIRGYFDGDGHIGMRSLKNGGICKVFNIVSTKNFLNGVLNFFRGNGLKTKVMAKKTSNSKAFILCLEGKYKVSKIFSLLYENATFFLKRKFDVFNRIFCASGRFRKVQMLDENLDLIKEFETISLACDFIGTSNSTLPRWIRKNKLFKGYFWQFAD